ncbi:MAG: OmcA/MtrC family decaheme c-type cytochrome [Wenzhouxiangellaceae bacterium]|nr:OmcA/MtrC family decaheme c-type cytochrome [Wenzhouxiangellaceae bacterium]
MQFCLNSKTTLMSFVALIGVLLVGFLAPQAWAEGEADDQEQLLRFFGSMPPEIRAQFMPEDLVLENDPLFMQGTLQDGPQRPPPEELFATITNASLQGQPVIDFRIVDQFNLGVEGLSQGENVEFSFTVNKLMPGPNGETNNWRTYVRGSDEGVPRIAPGTYSDGMLQDLGDGNYRFTFDTTLQNISNVPFQPFLTHRVGMEVRDAVVSGEDVPGGDAVFDIQPLTGNTSGIEQRRIITQEACATCHGTEEFAFHGGARQSVDYCVTCHQPFTRDAFSGNTLDFRVMIHKIHTGEDLNNKPYQFCGFGCENFGAPPDDFSDVVFPQDTRNCVNCHDPENPATPEAINIANRPTAAVCASCHDDLAFDQNGLTNANRNHIGLAQPNETCAACHSEEGLLVSALESHVIEPQLAARQFSYNILEITNTGEGQSPVITFSVTDPTNDDAPYDIANDAPFTGSGTRLAMGLAWPNTDFNNVSNDSGTDVTGRPAGQSISITLADGSGVLPTGLTDNGDGTFTVDTFSLSSPLTIPSTVPALGSGTVLIEGHTAADFDFDGSYDDEVPVTSATRAFAITDSAPEPRRMVVDVAKCQNCHAQNDGLALHGGNRSDNVIACATCHTPDATDLFRRPIDPDGMLDGVNMAAADSREDQSVHIKFMVHAIHSASIRETPYIAYGFGGSVHDYSDASYPRSPAECQACHVGDTYTLPLPTDDVLGTTVNSNATVIAGSRFGASAFAPGDGSASDPTDDNNISPEAAACVSCHDSSVAQNHMSVRSDSGFSFGNAFLMNPDPTTDPDTQALIDMGPQENCFFCHSESGFVPVGEAHGL